jgi:O-antigen/teichoic acid export membrane protein
MQVLVNKFFGPAANAAQAVSNTVGSYAGSFAVELAGAYAPAVCSAYGEGDLDRMREMGGRVSKLALLVSLALMLPLSLELPEILRLWLGKPPAHAVGLVFFALAAILVGQSVAGQDVVTNATGRVAWYQAVSGCLMMAALPLALCFVYAGAGLTLSIGGALLASSFASAVARALVARRTVGMGLRRWLLSCLLPVAAVATIAAVAGGASRLWMAASPVRVCVTIILVESVFLPLAWRMVLNDGERRVVTEWASRSLRRLRGGE